MSLPVTKISYLRDIYSPFSGLPSELGECGGEANQSDPSLLFIYYGNSSGYAYVSSRVVELVDGDPENFTPVELAERLAIEGGLVLQVDNGWNGVNSYGFAPIPE